MVGGMVGYNGDTITNSFSAGEVFGNTSVGGFAGVQTDTVSNTYWDLESSNQSNPFGESYNDNGIKGLNSNEMKGEAALNNMNLSTSIWKISSLYPKLHWE